MNVGLWISQLLLASLFTSIGVMKIVIPITKLSKNMKWVEAVPVNAVRAIGILEVVLGLLLLIPRLSRFLPNSAIGLASYGIIAIMLGAIYIHLKRQEYSFIMINILLVLLAGFVAYAGKKLQVF